MCRVGGKVRGLVRSSEVVSVYVRVTETFSSNDVSSFGLCRVQCLRLQT